jgi:hypothetical protein
MNPFNPLFAKPRQIIPVFGFGSGESWLHSTNWRFQ